MAVKWWHLLTQSKSLYCMFLLWSTHAHHSLRLISFQSLDVPQAIHPLLNNFRISFLSHSRLIWGLLKNLLQKGTSSSCARISCKSLLNTLPMHFLLKLELKTCKTFVTKLGSLAGLHSSSDSTASYQFYLVFIKRRQSISYKNSFQLGKKAVYIQPNCLSAPSLTFLFPKKSCLIKTIILHFLSSMLYIYSMNHFVITLLLLKSFAFKMRP